jgi:Fe2+ or Zn2+ uptake regulation protein
MSRNISDKTLSILAELKSRGHRHTKTRQEVIEHFVKKSKPISAVEILDHLKSKKLAVNKSTVYREIFFLKEQGIINEIDLLEGQKRYELNNPDDHHHHLVCIKCSSIQCVEMPGDLDKIEKDIQRKHQFQITGHILEFFGVCSSCK